MKSRSLRLSNSLNWKTLRVIRRSKKMRRSFRRSFRRFLRRLKAFHQRNEIIIMFITKISKSICDFRLSVLDNM